MHFGRTGGSVSGREAREGDDVHGCGGRSTHGLLGSCFPCEGFFHNPLLKQTHNVPLFLIYSCDFERDVLLISGFGSF